MAFLRDITASTFSISYLGQLQLGGAVEYVESVHFYSLGTTDLLVNMVAVANCLSIDFLQGFASTQILDSFLAELTAAGIAHTPVKQYAM